MKLKYENDGKLIELEAPIHTDVTSKTKNAFLEKLKDLKIDPLEEEKAEAYKGVVYNSKDEIDLTKSDLGTLMKASVVSKKVSDIEIIKKNDEVTIELFKFIVDWRRMSQEQRDMFDVPATSELWQNQDIVGMNKEVTLFRSKAGI